MSDYSYATSYTRSHSRSNDSSYIRRNSTRYAHEDMISEIGDRHPPSRHRRGSDKKSSGDSKYSGSGLPAAPFPPSPPSHILPYHPNVNAPPPVPLAPQPPSSRGRLSQPSTPPNRGVNNQRVYSAPQPPPFAGRVDYGSSYSPTRSQPRARSPPRIQPRAKSPSYSSHVSHVSQSRPTSSGHDSVSRRIIKARRNSSRSTRSSPKQKRFPWPPPNCHLDTYVTPQEALEYTANGALEFQGKTKEMPFTDDRAHRFYADIFLGIDSNKIADDKAPICDMTLKDISLTFMTGEQGWFTDKSLEYPNMLYAYGRSPGTTTLDWFVGMRGDLRSPVNFADTGVKRRKMKLIAILERLGQIETQSLQESPIEQYHALYDSLIDDPHRNDDDAHYELKDQIIDLMYVLMNRDWIDFSIPKNQVVAKFFDSPDERIKTRFFHQLLLAAELHIRIHSPYHDEETIGILLERMPPKVLWDLALAQRWLENMLSEQLKLSEDECQFNFVLQNKKRQIKGLRHFARLLKWPNLEELDYVLKEHNARDTAIEDRSADTMSWFSSVILPGPTLPFLIMNSLIDCDEDTEGKLSYLTHVKPNCGFQYRANTYWSSRCIMGKVLGASRGVKEVGGWIGPCHYAPRLERTQCVLVRTKTSPAEKAGKVIERVDIEDMHIKSHPLGPEGEEYSDDEDCVRIGDFDVPLAPDPFAEGGDVVIRIQKLDFETEETVKKKGANVYDAKVVFAIHGANVSMRLRYDVDFVCAPMCANGPHALWNGYKTHTIRVEEGLRELKGWGKVARRGSKSLVVAEKSMTVARRIANEDRDFHYSSADGEDWGSEYGENRPLSRSRRSLPTAPEPPTARLSQSSLTYVDEEDEYEPTSPSKALTTWKGESAKSDSAVALIPTTAEQRETTLLIDATGVSDNEVFARAWCANWGAHAIIANIRETCIACAVREARAAEIEVVILTEGGNKEEKDQGVWDNVSTMS
ncbi:hypothetical protein BT63DRAFT_422173 [Microthyrium microscopicum]|uniref:Uncharacterized protein n=1 Tax=Microthyrium microscopicum TaxID=703497 RepID=A0A6A6UJI8_9PEZI|nr:hypothetical protein BT63DRAFT_422173 [Microthyrium microscopicum]